MGIDDIIVEKSNFDLQLKTHKQGYQYALMNIKDIENHAPSVLMHNDYVFIVWFAGSEMGKSDVAIYMSKKKLEEDIFTIPVKISKFDGYSCQNPIIIWQDDKLCLYHTIHPAFKRGEPYREDNSLVVKTCSEDNGETWSKKEIVFDQKGFFIRANPIIENNRILFPVYYTNKNLEDYHSSIIVDWTNVDCTNVDWTNVNWTNENIIPNSQEHLQPCLIKFNHKYHIYMRDYANNKIHYSESTDGITWSPSEPTELSNNNSGIAFLSIGENKLVAICNTVYGHRYPLELFVSQDGKSFKKITNFNLEIEIPQDFIDYGYYPELSYPAMDLDENENENLHIVFTYCRGGIEYVMFKKEEWLKWFL